MLHVHSFERRGAPHAILRGASAACRAALDAARARTKGSMDAASTAQNEEDAARPRDARALPAAPGRLVLAQRRARWSSASCRSGSSTTRPTAWLAALLMRLLVAHAWPAHLEREARAPRRATPPSLALIPALIVFAYLAIVVYIGVFAFRRAHGRAEVEDYFLAEPLARPVRVPDVALRHEHDRVRDPRLLGPRLRQRHRHLRPDGLVRRRS